MTQRHAILTGETGEYGGYRTMKNYEVIGNIHDNPELLEGGIEQDEK